MMRTRYILNRDRDMCSKSIENGQMLYALLARFAKVSSNIFFTRESWHSYSAY